MGLNDHKAALQAADERVASPTQSAEQS